MAWIWGNQQRPLSFSERSLIKEVFRTADLPDLSNIQVRDGLGTNGAPFTTSGTTGKVLFGRLRNSPEQYLIMVGPALFAEDLARAAPSVLVHEMVHVWQYKHKKLTELRGLMRHTLYYLRGRFRGKDQAALYRYDVDGPWDEIGFEGQAQLVEDWYAIDRMSEKSKRWEHVKRNLLLDQSF